MDSLSRTRAVNSEGGRVVAQLGVKATRSWFGERNPTPVT